LEADGSDLDEKVEGNRSASSAIGFSDVYEISGEIYSFSKRFRSRCRPILPASNAIAAAEPFGKKIKKQGKLHQSGPRVIGCVDRRFLGTRQ